MSTGQGGQDIHPRMVATVPDIRDCRTKVAPRLCTGGNMPVLPARSRTRRLKNAHAAFRANRIAACATLPSGQALHHHDHLILNSR